METIPFIKNTRIICDKNNPFEGDRLERAPQIRNLTRIIESSSEPMVIAINGTWGSGKTTFIEMWKCYLECFEKPYATLYFNAWENDFSKDPFASLVAEIKQQILDLRKEKEGPVSVKTEEFIKQSSALLLKSLPTIVKLITNGVLDIDALKSLNSSSKDGMSEALSKFTESLIKEKSLQKEFRKSLEELADSFTHHKIIFFIDELDRCRPTYAVELLENIKHFFNVKGMVFVIAMDKVQLGHSLKTLYGAQMDTEGYLRRFIDLNYNLPQTKPDGFIKHLPQLIDLNKYVWENKDRHPGYNSFLSELLMYARLFNMTLRDLEHLFTYANIAIRNYWPQDTIQAILVPFLLVLKIKYYSLYQSYTRKEINTVTFIEALEKIKEYKDFTLNISAITDLEISIYIASGEAITQEELLLKHQNRQIKYDQPAVEQFRKYINEYPRSNRLSEIIEIIEFSGKFS